MVVAKKSSRYHSPISYGSAAYDYDYKKYEYENLKENHKSLAKHKHKTNPKKQLKLLGVVVLMLCTGMLIVGRYALIVNLNRQYQDMGKTLDNNKKANENLNIELMKYDDIKQIEKNATTKLNMVRPDNSNIVHINIDNIDKNQNVASTSKVKKPEMGFIGRIAKFFN